MNAPSRNGTGEGGFSLIELLVVVFLISAVSYFGWEALSGWRERNALNMVSQDVLHTIEKYRKKAVEKGYNYGLIFSDNGIYVFEDNGGSSAEPFRAMNNFAVDSGEFSDLYRGGSVSSDRDLYRVTQAAGEFGFFSGEHAEGRILIMTAATLGLESSRSGTAYDTTGTDITSSAYPAFTGGAYAPFTGGTLALFFAPDGGAYLKDPTVAIRPDERFAYQLGNGTDAFYVVRIAYDDPGTAVPDVPNYFEIAVNRYGATTFVRWHTGGAGGSWDAEIR